MNTLVRHSEPFSPDGNLSAEGFENLLGTPSLDLLAVLVREAIQNSCDATRSDPGFAEIRVRVRKLTSEQREVLKQSVLRDLPPEESAAENLNNVLNGDEPLQVLEIADYGTTGLGGPTRADVPLSEGETPDFVNFFRNVGAARDVEGGGGTYGYGKATLYRASKAHAIIVDTSTTERGLPVRRFMAAQMGKAIPGQFTGRHWWGLPTNDGRTVDPITGQDARNLAERLGMPERYMGLSGRGTTIMIIAPHLPAEADIMVGALTEYILWNFWPRMMRTTPNGKGLRAWVAKGEEEWKPLPEPERFPPINLLCHAMNALRGEDLAETETETESIRLLRPIRDLGRLATAKGQAGQRRWLMPPRREDGRDDERPTSIFPERLHHVALMRPAQLVVRYEPGAEAAEVDQEWGGVFMCSQDEDIENAFAKSEPPAHDDWQPESLPHGSMERRYVNVALRRIRERISGSASASESAPGAHTPLARASTALGRLLGSAQGDAAGRRRGSSGGGTSRSRPFTQPRPHALRTDDAGNPVAEFEFEVHADGRGRHLSATPTVMIDGSPQPPDEATGIPQLLEWVGPDGSSSAGENLIPHVDGQWLVRVSVPGEIAIGLRLRENEEQA